MKIRPADATGRNPDADFAFAWLGIRAFLEHERFAYPLQNHRLHLLLRLLRRDGSRLILPMTPMGRIDFNGLAGQRVGPAIPEPSAACDQRVDVAGLKHRHFKIAVEWRSRDRVPIVIGHVEP